MDGFTGFKITAEKRLPTATTVMNRSQELYQALVVPHKQELVASATGRCD